MTCLRKVSDEIWNEEGWLGLHWNLPAALLCRCRTSKQNGRCWREQSEQNCFISVPNCWFNTLVSLSHGGFPRISVALDHWTREKSCPKRSHFFLLKAMGFFAKRGSTFTKHETDTAFCRSDRSQNDSRSVSSCFTRKIQRSKGKTVKRL